MTDSEPAPKIVFNYIKSNFFRVIHADGVIGGLTPRGLIHCALFSERLPIPRVTEHLVDMEKGVLLDQTIIEGRQGIVRELEIDIFLTKTSAKELIEWLNSRISELEAAEKAIVSSKPEDE